MPLKMKAKNGLYIVRLIVVIYQVTFFLLTNRIIYCFGSSIVSPPSPKTATEGFPVELSCIVNKLPPGVNVSWMQDDQEITNQNKVAEAFIDRFKIEIKTDLSTITYTLRITNVIREDSSFSYRCQINEPDNIQKSEAATVEVRQVPGKEYPRCIQPVDNIKEGDTVELECQSENVKPMPKLEWQYNGKSIPWEESNNSDSIFSIKHSFTVTKNHVYNNTFCCIQSLKIMALTRNCSIGPLRILYKPVVEIIGEDVVEVNKEHVFICNSPTYPTPMQYVWEFDPPLLPQQYRTESQDMVLRISHLTRQNDGTTITCQVQNSAGWGIKRKQIQVIGDAHISTPSIVNKRPVLEKPKTDRSSSQNNYSDMTTAMILSIAGCSLLVLSLLAATLLCYFYMCVRKRYLHGSGYKIAQPDVYSEPRDNLPAPAHTVERVPPWMQRTVGIQVRADLPLEMGEIYTEIPKSIEQTKKEEYIKPASRSV